MSGRVDVMFIASGGGHLAQLRKLMEDVAPESSLLVTERTAEAFQMRVNFPVLYLPHGGRERPVRFLFMFVVNVVLSAWRLLRARPKVIVTTGAHTAIPTCVFGKLLGAKIIFIESLAKVSSPTLTGRILYPISDAFYVQWDSMRRHYPKAKMVGRIY